MSERILQQFDCLIIDRKEDSVFCELVDLTDVEMPNELADIRLSSFRDCERDRLSEGVQFKWSIVQIIRNGDMRIINRFSIYDPPTVTEEMLAAIREKAATIAERIGALDKAKRVSREVLDLEFTI